MNHVFFVFIRFCEIVTKQLNNNKWGVKLNNYIACTVKTQDISKIIYIMTLFEVIIKWNKTRIERSNFIASWVGPC